MHFARWASLPELEMIDWVISDSWYLFISLAESVFVVSACRSELHSRWRRWRIVHCMAPHHLTWRRHSHVSPTCRTDAGSGPPPLNSLTFRPVVGQLSEVVPFLLPEQRCGMACQAMLRRPRRCRCSRTSWRHTCPPLLRNCLTSNDIPFPRHISPLQNSGPCNSFYCLGHFKNVYNDQWRRQDFVTGGKWGMGL